MGSLDLSMRLGSVATMRGGYTFTNAEAAALVARFTTPPTDARKALIDNLVGALKAASVWSKLDAFYVLAAADSQAARRNWIADAYNATAVSAPTFTADRGYQGDGSSSYLATGFNPSTAPSPKYTRDSGHLAVWSRTNALAGYDIGIGASVAQLSVWNGSANTLRGRLNGSSLVSIGTNPTSLGYFAYTRTGASVTTAYYGATDLGSESQASVAVPSANAVLLAAGEGAGFSTRQLAAGHIGSALTQADATAINSALNTYLTAVGAA